MAVADKGIEMTLVDNDRVEISNLHRQLFFTRADVGRYKTDVICERLRGKITVTALSCPVQDVDSSVYAEQDIIVCALDNIEGRMHLNYMFKMLGCRCLVDIGVDGHLAHCKVVWQDSPCLYCIRDLYQDTETPGCTLRHPGALSAANRRDVILALASRAREQGHSVCEYVLPAFNQLARSRGVAAASRFEIEGIVRELRPSVVYINSIAASLAWTCILRVLRSERKYDFMFLNMNNSGFFVQKLQLAKSKSCVLCDSKQQEPPAFAAVQ